MTEINKDEISTITNFISNEFSISGFTSVISSENFDSLNQLKEYLTKKISELMDNNFDKLINMLYRIDVHEEKVQKAFIVKEKKNIPEIIAALIIERQLQKIELRKRFKERKI